MISCEDLLEDFVECGVWLCHANENLLKLQVHGPIPNLIRVDATSVRQVVYNLLANAARCCVVGTVAVHFSCKRRRGVSRLAILISDTGTGLTPQQCARIMAGLPIAKPSPYRGLGLRVVKRELARLKGSLDVFSAPDAGSAFSVRIPVEVVESSYSEINYPPESRAGQDALNDGVGIEELERVAEYARSGEITKILQWIERMTTRSPGRRNTDRFIELVHKAAHQRDMEMIVQAVQALLEGRVAAELGHPPLQAAPDKV